MQDAVVDYLTVRLGNCHTLMECKEWLKMKDCHFGSVKKSKCQNAYEYENTTIFGGQRAYYGMLVEQSGKGCTAYRRRQEDPFAHLKMLQRMGPTENIIRLDIAIDDMQGLLDMDVMREKIRSKDVRTKLDSKHTFTDLEDGSFTIYLGSSSSRFQVRIYNKSKESNVNAPWIRVEMILRNKEAKKFLRWYQSQITPEMSGEELQAVFSRLSAQLLMGKVAFLEKRTKNVSRSPVWGNWSAFLGKVTPRRLPAEPSKRKGSTEKWLEDCVGGALAAMTLIRGPKWLMDLLVNGTAKCRQPNSKYQVLLAEYAEAGVKPAMELTDTTENDLLESIINCISAGNTWNNYEGGEPDEN